MRRYLGETDRFKEFLVKDPKASQSLCAAFTKRKSVMDHADKSTKGMSEMQKRHGSFHE